ncbi:MAG: acyl-CoA thioesterase [Candidatus Hydrogenedentales bacterium]|jgi:1,4-dihydroxy-2-naphthoyl-CoA hydrolase
MFNYPVRISLRDGDAAGVLFFGRYFALAHDAYETFLNSKGLDIGHLIRSAGYLIPVVHAESDYRRPLFVGEQALIHLRVAELRSRTFTLDYEFHTAEGRLACRMRTVHCAVNAETRRAAALPEEIVHVLKDELEAEGNA